MEKNKSAFKALWYEVIGFSLIIALSWANELANLSQVIFGGMYHPNWRESVIETAIVILVAIPILVLTRRLMSRLYYLEGFLRICAWCKKLEYDGHQWVPIEEFFQRGFDTQTSHGICPACSAKAIQELSEASSEAT